MGISLATRHGKNSVPWPSGAVGRWPKNMRVFRLHGESELRHPLAMERRRASVLGTAWCPVSEWRRRRQCLGLWAPISAQYVSFLGTVVPKNETHPARFRTRITYAHHTRASHMRIAHAQSATVRHARVSHALCAPASQARPLRTIIAWAARARDTPKSQNARTFPTCLPRAAAGAALPALSPVPRCAAVGQGGAKWCALLGASLTGAGVTPAGLCLGELMKLY